jgi:hypothetical protein
MRHGGRRRRGHRYHGGSFQRALAGCAIAGLAVAFVRSDLWWLVALGMALHIFEDLFSGHGTALAWPFTSRRFGGDGRQPAARAAGRAAGSTSRPPVARRPASRRPADRADSPRPANRGPRPSKAMCLHCLLGECPECTDRGCGCPERGVHALRSRKRPATVTGSVVPDPAGDKPPF